jgi:hypothetical protein
MAGDWIKMRTDLAEDPAVIAMAAALGDVDEDLIVGKLHRLWAWADSQSRDGHATGVTYVWIDRYLRCPGFAQALSSVGWLLLEDKAVTFPNFDRHNGETAKTRALGAKRKQKQRSNVTENVPDTSRNDRDKTVTREEKRREEIRAEEPSSKPPVSTDLLGKAEPTDLKAARAERLSQVTDEAIASFNASALVKPNGGMLATVSPRIGREKRQGQVGRCLRTARAICAEDYQATTIVPEFWPDYWKAIASDDFMAGRQTGGRGHERWLPDFEYLTREATMLKVYDRAASEDAA